MAIDQVHPYYLVFQNDWSELRDCYAGEAVVKARGQKYLPPTQGMILDGMINVKDFGYMMYEAYKLRAIWHDLFKEAVEAYIGLLHSKPPQITLPDKMKDIKSNHGETLEQLLRRINEEQLVTGRLGLLTDLPLNPDPAKPLPYIAMYGAESVRNWDDGENQSTQTNLQYVILDESGYGKSASDQFAWEAQTRYRVCMMQNGIYQTGLFQVSGGGIPPFTPETMTTPTFRGTPSTVLPFTFVNSKDLLSSPDRGPLLGLARIMFGIYRGEADYRQNLFMQGQDTLVTIGGVMHADPNNPRAALRTGAGTRIDMEAGGDAKYIGVNSEGLPEQRMAISNDRQRAEIRAGQLVKVGVGDKESGEALKTRLAAQTATLTQIALTGGAALEAQLKFAALWMGEDPTQIKVEPNEEFSSTLVTGQDAFQLMQAKDLGLPISYESIHAYMVDRGITKKNFEEEFKAITEERAKVSILMNPVVQEQNKPQPPAPIG